MIDRLWNDAFKALSLSVKLVLNAHHRVALTAASLPISENSTYVPNKRMSEEKKDKGLGQSRGYQLQVKAPQQFSLSVRYKEAKICPVNCLFIIDPIVITYHYSLLRLIQQGQKLPHRRPATTCYSDHIRNRM